MKKNKKELIRIQSLLESDRLCAGDNFLELLTVDLTKLLKEYFDFPDVPRINIEKKGSFYELNISLLSTRIRSFDCMPK
ncbi:MAG: hypothetical protein E7382_05620 [Clostridiales bacterium]|nr:hypothetical protein [Clostridiales bacterium]